MTDQNAERLARPVSPFLDTMLGVVQPVLDKGFVRVIDYMGNEAAICQAARVSYGKGTKSASDDRGLIRYLMRHRHSTPLEMCEIKLHVKLPVFVARQWIRHRTANVNEYSARYSILANEFYIPEPKDIKPQSKSNKQGRDGGFSPEVLSSFIETIRQQSEGSYQLYEELFTGWPLFDEGGNEYVIPQTNALDPVPGRVPHTAEHGMARELARMVLPTNVYTEWYWKIDLHNLLHFLSLRADPHAQMEIRRYAETICWLVEAWVPNVWEAFVDFTMNAATFSGPEMEVIRELLAPAVELGVPKIYGTSIREHKDFERKLGVPDDQGD